MIPSVLGDLNTSSHKSFIYKGLGLPMPLLFFSLESTQAKIDLERNLDPIQKHSGRLSKTGGGSGPSVGVLARRHYLFRSRPGSVVVELWLLRGGFRKGAEHPSLNDREQFQPFARRAVGKVFNLSHNQLFQRAVVEGSWCEQLKPFHLRFLRLHHQPS